MYMSQCHLRLSHMTLQLNAVQGSGLVIEASSCE